jgi:hypothetical protein
VGSDELDINLAHRILCNNFVFSNSTVYYSMQRTESSSTTEPDYPGPDKNMLMVTSDSLRVIHNHS